MLVAVVRAYRAVVSPLLPAACRFVPSCSEYAEEAIVRRGALAGSLLAVRRLLRCHPWGGSGYDPVVVPCTADATKSRADDEANLPCRACAAAQSRHRVR